MTNFRKTATYLLIVQKHNNSPCTCPRKHSKEVGIASMMLIQRGVTLENCFLYRIFFKEIVDKHEFLCTNIWAFTMKQLLTVES